MDFFGDHAVLFALVCAGVAVAYGLWLTFWLLKQPAGTERMQEIARAVQEGASAYLSRQYKTIGLLGDVVEIETLVLVGVGDMPAVGRGDGLPAQHDVPTAVPGVLLQVSAVGLQGSGGSVSWRGARRRDRYSTRSAGRWLALSRGLRYAVPEDGPVTTASRRGER